MIEKVRMSRGEAKLFEIISRYVAENKKVTRDELAKEMNQSVSMVKCYLYGSKNYTGLYNLVPEIRQFMSIGIYVDVDVSKLKEKIVGVDVSKLKEKIEELK